MYQPQPQHPERQELGTELGYHLELDYLEDPANVMPSKTKSFECTACDATFHMRCFLNMHVRRVHGKEFDESMAKIAKIEEGKKTEEGENNTVYEKDPGMMA